MGRDRTEKKGKRRRSPPPKLEPIGPLWDALDAERKELIVAALIGNLVTDVVETYRARMENVEDDAEKGDATCE